MLFADYVRTSMNSVKEISICRLILSNLGNPVHLKLSWVCRFRWFEMKQQKIITVTMWLNSKSIFTYHVSFHKISRIPKNCRSISTTSSSRYTHTDVYTRSHVAQIHRRTYVIYTFKYIQFWNIIHVMKYFRNLVMIDCYKSSASIYMKIKQNLEHP